MIERRPAQTRLIQGRDATAWDVQPPHALFVHSRTLRGGRFLVVCSANGMVTHDSYVAGHVPGELFTLEKGDEILHPEPQELVRVSAPTTTARVGREVWTELVSAEPLTRSFSGRFIAPIEGFRKVGYYVGRMTPEHLSDAAAKIERRLIEERLDEADTQHLALWSQRLFAELDLGGKRRR